MLTYVGSENIGSFAPLLTPEARERAGEVNTLIYGAIDDATGLACGAAAVAATSAQANLLSLYVTPAHRRKGYGRAMLEQLIAHAKQAGIPAMAAVYELPAESAAPLEACLVGSGFQQQEKSPIYAAALGELLKAKNLVEAAETSGLLPMNQVPKSWLHSFNSQQQDNPAFVFDPIDPDAIEAELSTAIVAEDAVRGGIWVTREEGEYTIEGLYVPKEFARLLAPALGRTLAAAQNLPGDTIVRFVAVNPAVERLLERLFPKVQFETGEMHAMALSLA